MNKFGMFTDGKRVGKASCKFKAHHKRRKKFQDEYLNIG